MYMRGATAVGNNNYYSNKCSSASAKSLSSSNPSLNSDSDDDHTDATAFAPVDEKDEYDSDLNVPDEEPEKESWSELVDKKVQRKMHAKDIKRQDVIYELIQTESQYVKTLQVVMKKMYHDGMKKELNYTSDILNAMFPCLDELIKLNGNFFRDMKLEQENSVNYCVDRIGNIILKHFGGDNGKLFRSCYGEFCSRHLEAVALYKDFLKNDYTFQQFMKKRLLNVRTGRRDIPEIITYVTIRMTKYPLLIEAIIKATKETSPDFVDLKQSLNAIKEILFGVDEDVEAHDQEKELINLMKIVDSKHFVEIKNDASKAPPSRYKANKLFHKNTRLLYDKKVTLKSKNKFYDTRMVILSDKIIFFQENGGKLQLLNVDNKMPVMSLKGIMTRENAAEPKAIFLMNRSEQLVEMYEIIFEKNKDKPELLPKLEKYIANCPDEEEENDTDTEEEARKEGEEKLKRLKDLVDQLENANQEIRSHFETKGKIVQQLIEITDEDGCVKANTPTETKTLDVYNTRLQLEDFLSQVNAVLQSCSTPHNLTPESSPGETNRTFPHPSSSNNTTATKKSDTFGGFDNRNKPNNINITNRTSSNKSLPRNMSEPDVLTPGKRRQSQLMQVFGRIKTTGSNEDVNSASSSSLSNFVPPSLAEMQVYQHLSQGLGSLLEVTNQQDLAIERMRNDLKDSRTLQTKTETELTEMRDRLIQQQKESERQLRIERENYAKLAKEYKRTKEKSLKLAEQQQQRHHHHLNPNSEEMIV